MMKKGPSSMASSNTVKATCEGNIEDNQIQVCKNVRFTLDDENK